MPITQSMCSSFKSEVLNGTHALATDVIKMALYTSAAVLDAATTAYMATGEVVGAGYSAGGNTLAGAAVTLDGTTGICTFSDSTWTAATITARAALVYNSSKANRAIAVLDFGADKTTAGTNFVVSMPAATATTALVRIS